MLPNDMAITALDHPHPIPAGVITPKTHIKYAKTWVTAMASMNMRAGREDQNHERVRVEKITKWGHVFIWRKIYHGRREYHKT